MRKFFSRGSGDSPQLSPVPSSSTSAVSATGPARPIRLVYCDDKGKFRMDPEAVATLQLVKEPIGVVSVCGRARQGKSFVLNQLLGRSSGFQVASTHRPCTKGLWLWSAPIRRTALDGTEYNLLLLDSEGIDAYDQTMGGIDEAALDRLSLVTDMTKHIRVRASGGRSSASELGQFSPIFVWLLRDFYLDLVEDNRKITPHDYLELALRPVQGSGRDIAAKNELDKLRPEFRSGLDSFTKFVFERTRPKQIGATESCKVVANLPENRESALLSRKLVGNSPQSRRKRAPNSQSPTGAMVDYKRDAFREAYLQCLNVIQYMEMELRTACHAPDAKVDYVLKIFDDLVTKYEASCHGPEKWQKLTGFLRQSLEGPVVDLIKKQIDQIGSEKSSVMLKCRSIEDKMGLLNMQLEASEKYRSEYLKRYEDAINDKKKLADDYMSRISNLQSKCSSLEERCSSLSKTLDSGRQESADWKRKYEQVLLKQKAEEGHASSEIAILKSRSSAAEARLAASREQAQSAQGEAEEWKRKYDIAVRETKAALEKAVAVQDRTNTQTQLREDALRAEFSVSLAEKEEEIKDRAAKIEHAEQRLTNLSLELKAAESKIKNYDLEISTLKLEMKDLAEKLGTANATAQSFEEEARILNQEKVHLEQRYRSEFDRFEEVQDRCKTAEREAVRATELADNARAEAVTAQKQKNDIQRIAMERLAQIERAERHIENLGRQKADLANEAERYRVAEMDAVSKVAMLEARVEEREKEIESLLKCNNEQRASTVQVLESLLETERAARAEANNRAEALSVQLQATQGKLDSLQQKLTRVQLNELALDGKLKTAAHGKRARVDNFETGIESFQDMDENNRVRRGNKRSKSTTSPLKFTQPEDGGSVFKGDEENHSQQTSSEDYTKFTVQKLKQELTKHNFGAELLQLKNPNKKDIVSLYEKCILQKS
ncbi:guanylate-binding family protein [Actinidia rufa]|uniref:Guanylate-binding family protein n=1 Tax=Actinidia rufa TaxID=165716 RepID=A0A7J0EZN4_9ERIC|nr:guanylate-binding family protein [Actinidia rufa]